jgi:hypothetical protein
MLNAEPQVQSEASVCVEARAFQLINLPTLNGEALLATASEASQLSTLN